MRVTEVTSSIKPFVLGWLDNALAIGGRDLGAPGAKFGAIYADSITVDTLAGTLAGQTWTYAGDMTIDADAGSNTVVYVLNGGAGQASLNVQKDIVVGGLVDGVDIGAFKSAYDVHTHAHNTLTGIGANDHHNQAHSLDGSDHIGTLSWSKVNKAGSALADLETRPHSSLTGVTANQHHNQIHNISGADHTITAALYSVVGATATNTLGILATTNDGGANVNTILRSSGAGNLRLSSLTTPLIDTASGNLTLTPASDVILSDNKALRSSTFVSGFAGSGFRLLRATDAALELDRLVVRGQLSVYELLINQIRATNGSLFVSSSGKVANVAGSAPYTIVTDGDHGFAVGDLIRAQRFTGTGVYQSNMQVTVVSSTTQFSATLSSGVAPAAGFEFVRLGSTSDVNRRGAVYLTADDSGAPFIDITDGVASFADWTGAAKTKVRLGKLAGISDPDLSPTGYGLYSTNAYLKGSLVAANGTVTINPNGIYIAPGYSSFHNINFGAVDTLTPLARISTTVDPGKNRLWLNTTGNSTHNTGRILLSALSWAGGQDCYLNMENINGSNSTAELRAVTTTVRSSQNSVTAFTVQNSAGSAVATVDTTNQRVGIGTASPGDRLQVKNDVASGSSARIAHFGGKPNWTSGDYEEVAVGFNAIRSHFNNTSVAGWELSLHSGTSASMVAGTQPESVRIARNGTVGIGRSTPGAQLDVKAISASTIGLIVDTAASPTANAQEWNLNGTLGVRMNITTTSRLLAFEAFDNGSSTGTNIFLGRNANGSTPASGYIRLQNRGGVSHQIWPDNAGNLRIWTGGEPTSANDTSGTVVGTQTSMAAAKNIGRELSAIEDVLHRVAAGAQSVRQFVYKSGSFNNEEFEGVITDLAPHYGMDRDEAHPQGKSLNEMNILGDLLRAVDNLRQRVDRMEKI